MTCRDEFGSHNISAKIKCRLFAVDGTLLHLSGLPPHPSILVSHIFHLRSDDSYNAAPVRQIALFRHLPVEKPDKSAKRLGVFSVLESLRIHITHNQSIVCFITFSIHRGRGEGTSQLQPEPYSHQPSLVSTYPPSGTHCLRLVHIQFGRVLSNLPLSRVFPIGHFNSLGLLTRALGVLVFPCVTPRPPQHRELLRSYFDGIALCTLWSVLSKLTF
jgi:hypothetical protein